MINILIDELTNSIRHRATGAEFETILEKATLEDIQKLKGWLFDWQKTQVRYTVHKLITVAQPDIIQGLIATAADKSFVYIELVENAPFNIGSEQMYQGVGGNLFAYACKMSFELGFDGYVSFIAKTELIEHYRLKMFAKSLSAQKMYIDTEGALKLVNQYFSKKNKM